MPTKNLSRQSERRNRLMHDPDGPGMRRIDTLVPKSAWAMFRDIRDSMNLTQRQALEFALQLAFLFQVVQGKIPQDRFVELGAILTPKSKRLGNTRKDSEAAEHEPVE